MKYFMTFDVGTTAMKCILFDTSFNEVFYANKEYSVNASEGGFVELEADTYFNTFCECVEEIKKSNISSDDIASITFTTQGETLIPIDKCGNALCPAIVWLDTRAEEEAKTIKDNISDEEMYKTTGLGGIDGALPAAKILWLYKNNPDLYNKVYKFLLLEDYLIFRLTGKTVSEKSLQTSTGWYDIVSEVPFAKVMEICKIKEETLPEILPCATVVGELSEDIAKMCGLSSKTVVITGAMDQISSAVGVGNVKEGIFTETTGTALVAGITAEKPVFDIENPVTIQKHYDNKFIYMPYYNTAGMTLKWFRDNVMPYAEEEAKKRGISSYEFIDEVAKDAPAGSKGLIMLPGLSENGAFLGMTLATKTSDLARSVLEGVAYMLKSILELVSSRNVEIDEIYSLGGGSYSDLWCEIKADVCQKNIVRIDYAQTTALGAAILASVALGEYKSVEEALAARKIGTRVVNPNLKNKDVYDDGYKMYKKYLNLI